MPSIYPGADAPKARPAAPIISSQTGLSGGRGFAAPESDGPSPGKTAFDWSDPVASVIDSAGSVGSFIGGVAQGIGNVGIEGGPHVRDVFNPIAGAVGAVGKGVIESPVGSVAGSAFKTVFIDVLGAPGRFVEEQFARGRLMRGGREGNLDLYGKPIGQEAENIRSSLPPDILTRLDAGENVDDLARELVQRGEGFSSNRTAELGSAVLFDPLTYLSLGASAILKVVGAAGTAVKVANAADELGVATRLVGRTYNAIGAGLSTGRAAIARNVLGRSTSGVIHAIGIGDYKAVRGAAESLSPSVAKELDDLLASGNLQMARATIGDELATDASVLLRGIPESALPTPEQIGRTIETKLAATEAIRGNRIERNIEELFARVAPTVAGREVEVLSAALRITADDAARVLGTITEGKSRLVRLVAYAKAGEGLAAAKAAVGVSKKIDVASLTPIAEDTLTVDRAKALLSELDTLYPGDAASRFRVLEDRFGGQAASVDDIRDFINDLIRRDALPQEVHLPTTGRNALPGPLGAWRQEARTFGYDLGFAPKSGWVSIVDDAGNVIVTDPFIHYQSGQRVISTRNPIGQVADALMRGISQRTIINDSRMRMVRIARTLHTGLSASEARSIHRVILRLAEKYGVTPRGLVGITYNVNGKKGTGIHEAFESVLGPARLAELEKVADPVYLTMAAFRGNMAHVGLTQAITGSAKAASVGTVPVAQITEYLYPKARFEWNPLFQAQELVESDFWNALRGVRNVIVDPEMQETYQAFSNLPELRYLDMEYSGLYLWGNAAAQRVVGSGGRFGRFLGRFKVAERKQAARLKQTFFEHGEYFQQAIEDINPRLWRVMVEEYGTTDPRAIAQAFIKERLALARGEVDNALAGLPAKALDPDTETIYTAWRESFRQASLQAYKTHFFNPERGWLERTLNHPYLGFYPLSYMYGKVLPEFARFLLKRPFGLDAPLAGLNAVNRVQQTILAARATDPEFDAFLNDHKDAIYLIEVMLPGTPTNTPANAPAWARHLVEDVQAGRDISADTAIREIGDSARYAFGPTRALDVFGKGLFGKRGAVDVVTDIYENLDQSAKQYDAFVGSPGVLPRR